MVAPDGDWRAGRGFLGLESGDDGGGVWPAAGIDHIFQIHGGGGIDDAPEEIEAGGILDLFHGGDVILPNAEFAIAVGNEEGDHAGGLRDALAGGNGAGGVGNFHGDLPDRARDEHSIRDAAFGEIRRAGGDQNLVAIRGHVAAVVLKNLPDPAVVVGGLWDGVAHRECGQVVGERGGAIRRGRHVPAIPTSPERGGSHAQKSGWQFIFDRPGIGAAHGPAVGDRITPAHPIWLEGVFVIGQAELGAKDEVVRPERGVGPGEGGVAQCQLELGADFRDGRKGPREDGDAKNEDDFRRKAADFFDRLGEG